MAAVGRSDQMQQGGATDTNLSSLDAAMHCWLARPGRRQDGHDLNVAMATVFDFDYKFPSGADTQIYDARGVRVVVVVDRVNSKDHVHDRSS